MRAWLLLLAVLATFKPIVQVASTEDITSRFNQAISTPTIEQQKQQVFDWTDREGVATRDDVGVQRRRVTEQQQQQLETESKSPVIDITSLSVTKTTTSNKSAHQARSTKRPSTTSITTIFSYNKNSDSVTYRNNNNNHNNNLIKISAKDNRINKSERTNSSSEVRLSAEKNKNKENNKNKFENFNEVYEKSATLNKNNIVRTQEQQQQRNKVQHSKNTNKKIQQTEKTRTTYTKTLEAVSIVNSEIERAAANKKSFNNKMAINDNTIEMREQISKRQSRHKQHQRKHHHHHHYHHQNKQHKNIPSVETTEKFLATAERLEETNASTTKKQTATIEATNERLAIKESDETSTATTTTTPNSVTHIEAAERLAQESALMLDDSIRPTTDVSSSSTTTHVVDNDDDDSSSSSNSSFEDNNSEIEPATYSNKEIIGEKLKPDPSTLVQIENSLLSLFNMKRPPKIDRSKIIIPEAMKKLYAQIMGQEWDTVMATSRPSLLSRTANTVRSFTHIESKIDDRFPHHHRFRLYFDVKSIPTEEKLRAAELQLKRDAISDAVLSERLANRTRYQVIAYDITRVGIRGKRDPSLKLLDNKIVHLNSTETVSLNVQKAVNRWLATPNKNYGILIEVRTTPALKPAPHQHVRLRRSIDEPHTSWQHKQPVLYAYTDDGKHKTTRTTRDTSTRSKRAGHHRRGHRRKNSDEICRRHSLYVDFADVGWSDWIVAPPGYDAFYCQGKCPFPLAEHMNSTNHAVVQTLVNNLNPGKVPKACCVPTQLEGISMLYLNDQNTVVLKNYQDMTVVGCGCR